MDIRDRRDLNRPIVMRPPVKGKAYQQTTRLKFLRGMRRFLNNMGSFIDASLEKPFGIKAGAGDKYDLMERDYR